ncbi:hypothetical protein Yalta_163 [Yalta virus]|nr:hypothetical protein Yalta_163 [Yalta virus]
MYFVYETDFITFQSILDSGYFLTSKQMQSKKKYNIPKCYEKPKNISKDPHKMLKGGVLTYLDEVDATYFKIRSNCEIETIFSDCIFILEPNILKKYRFVFNTEPNRGFFIGKEGCINKSKLTGKKGISVSSYSLFNKTFKDVKFNSERSELAVLDQIHINDVKYIIMKNDYYTNDVIKKCLEHDILVFGSQ